jgi:hypothetical protein
MTELTSHIVLWRIILTAGMRLPHTTVSDIVEKSLDNL